MDESSARYISSDGHVIEPPDLWLEHLEQAAPIVLARQT